MLLGHSAHIPWDRGSGCEPGHSGNKSVRKSPPCSCSGSHVRPTRGGGRGGSALPATHVSALHWRQDAVAMLLLALLVVSAGLQADAAAGPDGPIASPFAFNVSDTEALLALLMEQGALPNSTAISKRSFMGAGALKTSRDILALWGYPHEQHKALTEDGYILSLDRIPNPGRPPVYMATPYIASATVFLNLGKGRALGFLLFDAGYDVWMINPRGSAYSTQHVRLDVNDPEYWKFGFHEHAVYDHPACVDAILAKTGYRQVIWAGFSLGSLTFLAMAALRPDYGQKVSAAFLMAPSTTQFYNPGIFLSLIKTAVKAEPLAERLESVVFPHALVRGFQQVACRGEARWICNRLWMALTSSAHEEDYIGNTYYFSETFPSAGSFRTTWHIAQLGWAENAFRPYIFPSTEKNLRLYGRAVPRNYPLERITTPIFTYTGDSDVLVHPKDYRLVSRSVRSLVRRWRHPDPLFSHADFIFSRRSLVLYKQILRDMAGFFQ